ncbi:hypothetical protein KKG52_02075 [Patescibacteria group bacterium]|nr:hypothetical protein [Patescibacteria group bacterium]
MISKKRLFVNNIEKLKIKPGFAFTIEPRIINSKNPKIPLASYHAIALFHEDGKKELLTGFNDVFKLVGMNYMLGK